MAAIIQSIEREAWFHVFFFPSLDRPGLASLRIESTYSNYRTERAGDYCMTRSLFLGPPEEALAGDAGLNNSLSTKANG